MKRSRWLIAVALVAVAAALLLRTPDWLYIFPGIDGPKIASGIVAHAPARIEDYERGSRHRLAILVTDPESDWLGLARAFHAHGIPFIATRDPNVALTHKVVLAYPIISGRALSGDALRALAAHVRNGGTVVGFDLAGGGLETVFGVAGETPALTRERLRWGRPGAPPEEQTTRFSRAGSEAQIGSFAYAPTDATTIARYEDGASAIVCRKAIGQACLVGVDVGALARRALDGRGEPIARRYVNGYEPSLDVLIDWVRDLYVAGEPMPWLIDTAPAGYDVAIVLSHDIDFTRSVRNARAYADAMRAAGVTGTFFMQAKYIRDYNDDVFLTKQTVPDLTYLLDAGMEIASHTVAHSAAFKSFPLGSGREHYPAYRPFVETRARARDGTIFGELRVSKYLLETLVGGKIVSFRPGELSYPFALPEALEATGYSYSSSITADTTLTNLPFQLTVGRGGQALAPIYEFPVTIEDEEAPRLGDRFESATALIAKIAAHHGAAIVLIHPDITDHKLMFERRLIAAWKDRAWIGPLRDYGAWWAARDAMDVDIADVGAGWTLTARGGPARAPLAILLPKAHGARIAGAGARFANHAVVVQPGWTQGSIQIN